MTSSMRQAVLRWAVACLLVFGAAAAVAAAPRTFDTPEAAMNAFGAAVAANDDEALKAMLGPDVHALIPPVGSDVRLRFLAAWADSHAVQPNGDTLARIAVGGDGWTLPIPLVKLAKGWQFDSDAGADEMRVRRIGRNERSAMQTLLAIRDAQLEYAAEDHDGDGILTYASKLASSPGKRDGLYWPTKPGEKPSPLGASLAAAGGAKPGPQGYHGYHYKLVTRQGAHASGGALSYLVRGKLFGGFAVMAWPVRYQDTGVTSFLLSHDGQVYERDLGPDTAKKAAATSSFDPGPGWNKVAP